MMLSYLIAVAVLLVLALLWLAPLRRSLLSAPVMGLLRQRLPSISATEREALEAGDTWWDAQLFTGRPDWAVLRSLPPARLSEAEQAFLDGPVEALCRMLDAWEVNEQRDLPEPVWRFIRDQGLLGMIIPRAYGGLGFSAAAHSQVVMKVGAREGTAGVTVSVPNSLGPAELLLRYGTEAQRNHYLPRLARGEEIPCFALTGPTAGSDAASIPDRGVVCYGDYRGERVLGMRVSWDKRYITLAPVATVLGLAFRLEDPDELLGRGPVPGITVALIPTDHPGVEIGRRHFPAGVAFQNGPTRGRDVFIPLDFIIGGPPRAGQGWRMLMGCLAAGRSISLPAAGVGNAKLAARTAGAYARVRRQFNTPVGRFEGVQEALTRIAGQAYRLDAGRWVTTAALDAGIEPAVISAILKYQATAGGREAITDAMDVHGGKAICTGPSNTLFGAYQALPVGITVEGANILTRSMIVFGQGALRCHPWLLREVQTAQAGDLTGFDRAFWGHVRHLLANLGRVALHNATGGRLASAPGAGALDRWYRQLARESANFALVADAALLILGGELKRRERLSGRLADVLSELYLMSCALKQHEDDGCPIADRPLLDWVCQEGLYRIQERLDRVLANLPVRPAAFLLRRLLFPWGRRRRPADDRLGRRVAETLLEPGEVRDRLTAGLYLSRDRDDATGALEWALREVVATEDLEQRLRQAVRDGRLPDLDGAALHQAALDAGGISEPDHRRLRAAHQAVMRVIQVDEFEAADLSRPGKVPRPAQRCQSEAA
ncbi:acyl-CoA dehydrogenase [Alkalilimnicola ehrlichii MLHE-1]|nr:acyl-CoA dehydrogenase [Alkalilimnicola ehrlichii]